MSSSDGIDQELLKTAGGQLRIEPELALCRSTADLISHLRMPSHLSTFAEIAKSLQSSGVSQLIATIQQEHRLLAAVARPNLLFADAMNQMAQLQSITESLTAPYHAIQEIMRSQASVFEALSSQYSEATMAWSLASIGLATRMSDIGLLAQREMLSARLLNVPNVYAEFVRHTTERLAADPSPEIATRLRSSLNLAEQQLLEITDCVSAFVSLPEDDEEPDGNRVLDAPFVQQDELLLYESVGDEYDTAALTAKSSTAQTVEQGRRVLELVTQCNEAGKTSDFGLEIFKPTTRLMTVFNDLSWITASDRLRFGDVIDCLYFIFYEGAGKDNLRFLDKHGGPLTDADCDLIWCIKHLRNKWLRHDADHGKEKENQKSWA